MHCYVFVGCFCHFLYVVGPRGIGVRAPLSILAVVWVIFEMTALASARTKKRNEKLSTACAN